VHRSDRTRNGSPAPSGFILDNRFYQSQIVGEGTRRTERNPTCSAVKSVAGASGVCRLISASSKLMFPPARGPS
jgi:hypothetical protein